MLNKSKRIFYFDALRAMAIIGIIFCHVSVLFVLNNLDNSNLYIAAFFDCLRDFSIPIFVMLSGILLINRNETFTVFFKKRFSRLLIPFIFWVLIYIIYTSDFTLTNITNILFGKSGTLGVTFWFVWMIILMYIGIFAINKIIAYKKNSIVNFDKKFIYLLTLISLIYFAIIHCGLFNPYTDKLIYFASFITYIIIGYFLANTNWVCSRVNNKILIVLTFAISIVLYLYYICCFVVPRSMASHSFVYLGYFSLLLLALSVNMFLVFKFSSKTKIFSKIENSLLGEFIVLVSKYSFGIYLVHYLIINILKNNLLTHISNPNPLVGIILLVAITFIISMTILWILTNIPYLNKLSGVNWNEQNPVPKHIFNIYLF